MDVQTQDSEADPSRANGVSHLRAVLSESRDEASIVEPFDGCQATLNSMCRYGRGRWLRRANLDIHKDPA